MEMENLIILEELPVEFFKSSAQGLFKIFKGPTLVHLKSKNPTDKPIFISTLLHGNEHSGIMILQDLLPELLGEELSRDLILFFGNIKAAKYGKRHLDSQPDYNRIWNSGELMFASQVLDYIDQADIGIAIDLHNNTGNNPCYSCMSQESVEHYNLAKLFSDKIVFFTDPIEALTVVLSRKCPSITIEAKKSGDPEGVTRTIHFLKKLMNGVDLKKDIDHTPKVFHTIGKIKIAEEYPVTFKKSEFKGSGFLFREDLDTLNFEKTFEGLSFGESEVIPYVEPHIEGVKSEDYFELKDNKVVCKGEFVPAMLTQDIEIIYSDGLGYIMKEEILNLT